MSFGEKRVWQQKDTWRGIAYGRYRDSREWRTLLELNQSYDIRYQPAPGTVIGITGETSQGKTTPGSSNIQNGTLTQVGTNLDLRFYSCYTNQSEIPGRINLSMGQCC